ncbi:MAG: beta-galactosidase trimerization domain-containing protein, partial [Candidatus Contubernalis sp.]|nr:beta-galactosidase trimerization domain-containing protein [Candidatus Contubernalis sp.]
AHSLTKGPVGPIRSPCFSNPAYRGEMEKALIRETNLIAPFAPLGYGLGDENILAFGEEDFCFSGYCLQDLQEYLKKEYGSLKSLNEEWETDFSDWSEVRPNTLSELQKRGEKKNFSTWIDHRLHMETVFADVHYLGRKTIEGVDKDAYVGAEGFQLLKDASFNGQDVYKLGAASRSAGGYGGTTLWRAFLPEDSLLWDWELYGRGITRGHRYPWRMLLSGGNGVGFYALDELTPDYTAFNPDYTLTPPFAAVVEGTKTVKEGVGRLLLSGKQEYSPIAILHSQPNSHLNTIISKQEEKSFNSSYQESLPGFENLLKTLWYYPNFVSHQQVKQGILKENKYQCLVLPSILAISKKEREEIKEFVNGGGIVIADVLPGFFDGHGKVAAENDLEEIFGVKRRWPSKFEEGVTLEGKQLPLQVAEELTLAGGKSSAFSPQGRPSFILNSYGKGKTLCLNILLPSCQNLKEKDSLLFSSFLNLQITSLGLNQLFKVTQEGEAPFFAGTGRFFSSDKNKYLFILPDKEGKVKIGLPEEGYLYNLLEGKFLGKGKELETTFDLKYPYLVSILPYRVTDLKIESPATFKLGEEIRGNVSIISDGNTPGLHVARIETYNPGGKQISYHSFNLLCPQGKGNFSIPLALNEAAGIWVIKIKDISTGLKNELSFKVIK